MRFCSLRAKRVGDVARMNRGDISEGLIRVIQEKTGSEVWVPIHDDLRRAMLAYGQGLVADR